jgi:hypothetical protein
MNVSDVLSTLQSPLSTPQSAASSFLALVSSALSLVEIRERRIKKEIIMDKGVTLREANVDVIIGRRRQKCDCPQPKSCNVTAT